jgi:SOS response regulatory protein OraA/RecX
MSLADLPDRRDQGNYQQKCLYLLNLVRQKDKELYKKLKKEFYEEVTVDETFEFYKRIQSELGK